MSDLHEELTGGWLRLVDAGADRLLTEVVIAIARAPASEAERIARTFVAFIMGPRVEDRFARSVLARAERGWTAGRQPDDRDPEAAALRARRAQLEAEFEARRQQPGVAALVHERDELSRAVEAKRRVLERLRQAIDEARSGESLQV